MKVIDYKCPSCGGKIEFNTQTQKWECKFCGSEYNLDQFEEKKEEKANVSQDKQTEYECYNCPNCGAEIILGENVTATFCVYCGSDSIVKSKLQGEFRPSKIIPFKKTKNDAINAFKNYKKGKLFIPNEFLSEKNIEKLSAIYIPFFIYDCDFESNIQIKATRVSHWSDSRYNYTKTDFYQLDRSSKSHFENIPVDGSTKFPDDIMNSIEPFNYADLTEFHSVYLSGVLSEHFDISMDKLFDVAKNRAQKSIEQQTLKNVHSYATKVITNSSHKANNNDTSEYALLPAYMLNVKYKDKIYTFAMNGQTGKFVGNIPVDKRKFWTWWFALFSATFIILVIIISLIS